MALDYKIPVDVKENISAADFKEKYLLPEKPLVIRNLWKEYPATTKWSIDFFKETMGDIKVGLFSEKETNNDRSFKSPHQYMKFGEYLDLINSKPTDLRIFLFNIFKHKPDLKNDFGYPDISEGFLKGFPFMFFGGAGSNVRIHQDMDMSNVFLTQLHGKKRVILFSPAYSDLLYRYPFSVHSSVNIEQPDYDKYPGLRYVKGYECILDHGDTLFIPSGWWHYITYLEGGYALSQRALSPHFSKRLYGFWKVFILSNLDDILRWIFGKKWYSVKEKSSIRRADRAINKINKKHDLQNAVT